MIPLQGRWAITGAAGRIGCALRAHLAGHAVALRSIDIAETEPAGPDDEVRIVDLRDLDATVAAVADCEGIVHLGGIPDEADFHDLVDVNVIGGYHVLEGARRGGVRHVVIASSNRVTGMYGVDELVDPSMPVRPDGFYGVSKVALEALGDLYARKFGVRTVHVRIGAYANAPADQRGLRVWLSPDDALRAFDAAMRADVDTATFYAVSANPECWWTLDEGAALGFRPVDASTSATELHIEPMPRGAVQAGFRGLPSFSTSRMRA